MTKKQVTKKQVERTSAAKTKGYIMILNTLLFIAIMLVLIVGITNSILSHNSSTRAFAYSKQSYLTAHSAMEEALYRLKNAISISSPLTVSFASSSATVTITNTANNGRYVAVDGDASGFQRKLRVNLFIGTGVSFHYGIQSGRGGFVLNNSSSVKGNVFSDGTISGSGNYIYGDVVSAEATGLVSGIHATGTAYAHTIQNSTIEKDAYYTSISGTTVGGIMHPGATDLSAAPLPISDAQINQWESDAFAGGTSSLCSGGTYSITSDTTLGPIKIPCSLSVKNATVTVNGPVWVVGNIDIKGSTIKMASSLGVDNVAVIADDSANPNTKGIITTDTSTVFYAAGCPAACVAGSYIFMISQNKSSENGGSTDAVSLGQSSSGIIAYAAHGQITLGQSVNLKEVTAYKIVLTNTAQVIYDTGLPSTLFEAGPSGGYDIKDWLEI